MSAARRRGGWLLAGGVIGGVALSPAARRLGMELRARATRLGRGGADPVAAFLAAPCYEHDRALAAEARHEAAREA